jgi:hypothetical protein
MNFYKIYLSGDKMDIKKPIIKDPKAYEILIRKRGINDYASYCPQLNYIIKGQEHEEVSQKMENYINEYIISIVD